MPVTQVYYYTVGEEQRLKYAQVQDEESGEERLLERHELIDPDSIDVGDEYAYKVSIIGDSIFTNEELKEE